MDTTNIIYARKRADGTTDYVVNLGSVLYNNRVVVLSNLIIPLYSKTFFTLPEDKDKYAAIDVYYNVDTGSFIFNTAKKSASFIQKVNSVALFNAIPIAQFIIRQSVQSFEVVSINQYSKKSTFAITKTFQQGDQGQQGPVGDTGLQGHQGITGSIGELGDQGETGSQGLTGVGAIGAQGPQGETGYYPDLDLLLYCKFKAEDDTLIDYSVYERDMGWTGSGAGYTGVGFTGPGAVGPGAFMTGVIFIEDTSSYIVEPGIVDNSYAVDFKGGLASFQSGRYFGFTGMIQTWVNVNPLPYVDFEYVVDGENPLRVTFTDTSLFDANRWEWDIGGVIVRTKAVDYVFPSSGDYLVTLTAWNNTGSSYKSKIITV